jgi:hypothetical protein
MANRISTKLLPLVILALPVALPILAQGPGGPPGPPRAPKAAAPIDLTGAWVSLVNEDWKYRMVMPAVGDYNGVPMTPAAVKEATAWDPAKDEAAGEQCRSYGAPALLRAPGMVRFSWVDDNTLKLEADAGTQTRTLHFGGWKAPAGTAASWQGDSVANWEGRPGTLKVVTNNLKPGYLRKNGVPYSANATLTEYFDLVKEPNGETKMIVTTIVVDSQYLRESFVISSNFKKQATEAGWKPSACSSKW